MRAGAAWEKRGRAVRSQGPTFLFCELAQHGRNGEAPMRAGAAWEKRGRAVRSQGPTFLFRELAQHGRNGGGPCAAKARPSFSASWRSMGETGEGRAQPRPDLPFPRAGAAWEKRGRLPCELAQHGRNGGGPCAAKARPSSFASWRSMGGMGRLPCELAQHGRNGGGSHASWRSMGETGEGRAQPRPDLPFPRAGAAWEKRGRAVRSQGPTFLFRELAQHGRNGGGPCGAKARPSSLRAGEGQLQKPLSGFLFTLFQPGNFAVAQAGKP